MKLFKNNRWLLIPILSSLLLLVLMKTVLFLGYVPTESMEPTLKKDSFILGTRLYGDLTDGDIIIFERDGRLLVKRITASGGEAVVRNGITLIVPENCYYVQGDNANHSYDSRFWSDPFVKESSIKAKLLGGFFILLLGLLQEELFMRFYQIRLNNPLCYSSAFLQLPP